MSTLYSSENEDDPDVYESSGSEWDSSHEEENTRKPNRRSIGRKKNTRAEDEGSSSSSEITSDEDEDDVPIARRRNGSNKKQKLDGPPRKPKTPYSKDYATGAFLIAKKDAQVGDRKKPPCIWRVDGKALLQKFEPFTTDAGNVRHRTTSIYTGWSPLDRDTYVPVTVTINKNGQTLTVDVNWEKLKEANFDSD